MAQFVTETGFARKTLQEIRADLEARLKQVFGPSFETSVDSPNGQLVGALSMALSNVWELAQEVYDSRDPAQATGVSLDFAAAINSIFRKEATACAVTAVLYTLDASATIPAGSRAMRTRGSLLFTLDRAVTISRAACKYLFIVDDGSELNTEYVFHFTFGDVTLENTLPGVSNLQKLHTLIWAAGGYAELRDGGLLVWGDTSVGITGTLPDDFEIYAGSEGDFTAVTTGPQTCEIGELDNIPTTVQGWNMVRNYVAGVPGTSIETDAELRIRRAQAARAIKTTGTDPALEAHLRNDVRGVVAARVVSNRKMVTDSNGRPPKSFEALVSGGTDEDVAQCIWKNQASGIESYGNHFVEIIDDNGDGQLISFSRAQARFLWVRVVYHLYDEEQFPGEDSLRASLVEWANQEYDVGRDVIPDRIYSALYPPYINGVGQATITVAVTSSENDTPLFGDSIIPIGPSEFASLVADRVVLVPAV